MDRSNGIYEKRRRLRSKDVNMYRRLKTSTLFELLQEASIRHTEELGMGREKTLDKGLLWILALQSAEIVRMPEYDEEVVLQSWPGITMHMFFPRYYVMKTARGEPLLKAAALWSLLDAGTRKMVFPEQYGIEILGITTGEELPQPAPPKRLPCTETTAFTVPYSYVDLNGHMNNTRYFDLAEDCIHTAVEGRDLRSVQAEYVSEVKCGDRISVSWGESGDSFYLEGKMEKPVFRMKYTYR